MVIFDLFLLIMGFSELKIKQNSTKMIETKQDWFFLRWLSIIVKWLGLRVRCVTLYVDLRVKLIKFYRSRNRT